MLPTGNIDGTSRTILGIDPGTATMGWGVVREKGTRLAYVQHGAITTIVSQFNSFSYDSIQFFQTTVIYKINIFTKLLIDNVCFLISFFFVVFRIPLRELRSGFKSYRNKVPVLPFFCS